MRSLAVAFALALLVAACGAQTDPARSGTILAVGAENQYANVLSQVGGKYVTAIAIMSNPNTDPHTFEASPSVATAVSSAQLVVQNGLGYDDFMGKIEAASPKASRKVIDVQKLLGLAGLDPQPPPLVLAGHDAGGGPRGGGRPGQPDARPRGLLPRQRGRFVRSLHPWYEALAQFRARYPGTPVATTEPVGDYMLQAAGTRNLTPFTLQADIMNGVDPAPQNVSLQMSLLSDRRVAALVYNQQVTDSLTKTFLSAAQHSGVPVVGVYETMPRRLRLPVVDGGRGGCPAGRGGRPRARRGGCERARPLGAGGERAARLSPGPRRRHVRDRGGRVHRSDRLQRSRQDHAVQGDPRAPGGEAARSRWAGGRARGATR